MQICEYFFENACYSVTKYYLCKQNNKRSLLGRKQRHQVVRSFPNRYLFSFTNKVTSLFPISCILEIILQCNWYSVRALPTPFWSPIKHLLKLAWQPIGLLLVADLLFCTCFLYLQMIYLKLCNDFSKSYMYSQRMKMKRSLYRRMITGWTADVDARHRTCCW